MSHFFSGVIVMTCDGNVMLLCDIKHFFRIMDSMLFSDTHSVFYKIFQRFLINPEPVTVVAFDLLFSFKLPLPRRVVHDRNQINISFFDQSLYG